MPVDLQVPSMPSVVYYVACSLNVTCDNVSDAGMLWSIQTLCISAAVHCVQRSLCVLT